MLSRLTLPILLLLLTTTTLTLSKSLNSRQQRDLLPHQQLSSSQHLISSSSNRQLGGGLSALGTLVSPLLFLMGMGSFISMLPQMFQTVLSGVGSNLIQSFTGGQGGGGGSSSTRLKRDVEEDLLGDIEKRLNLALLNYEGHRGV